MEEVILEFAACCRGNAMRVSTAEVLDCLAQLSMVSPWDEPTFYTILKTNFSKSRREQAEFDRLFHLFFKEMKKDKIPVASSTEFREESPETREDRADLDRFMAVVAEPEDSDLDRDLAAFMAGNPQMFIERVRGIHDQETAAVQAVKSNLGQLTRRLEIMLAVGRMRQRVVQFLGSMDEKEGGKAGEDTGQGRRERLAALAEKRLDKAMAFLNEDPRPDNAGLKRAGTGDQYFSGMGEIPFSNLTQDEMARVGEVVDQWVKKLKEISTLRFAASRKGVVDIRKTIHRSGRYLGVPVEIVRKDRPLRKGKIITLCDVSGSVWSTARFMLGILYALQSCFSRVKSHVFIDRPIEVTPLFEAHDANTAIKKILNDPRLNYSARTDYGLTFQEFRDHHLRDLDKKTTLIIMGDGRSNYLNPREPVLETLRERCRRLVWLNPEQEKFWGTGDSEMLRYRHYCNEARPCGNLNQLIDFIQELIL